MSHCLEIKGKKIYFLGIAGTGMASVAGLMKEAGYEISGSDGEIYPPMSTMLKDLGIKVYSPYNPENLNTAKPDVVVVANSLSRGHVEIEHVLANNIPYTSFPELLGNFVLKDRVTTVVSGTHGKTTTTALLAYVLDQLGEDPGFIIGGIPKDFSFSFRLGGGRLFAIEGDEYDTAFFDKGSKFLHYFPTYLILNNIEFDHADIFPNVEAIEAQFFKVIKLVKNPRNIIANIDSPRVKALLDRMGLLSQVTTVAGEGQERDAKIVVTQVVPPAKASQNSRWGASLKSVAWGTMSCETKLFGRFNIANIAQVVACLQVMEQNAHLKTPLDLEKVRSLIASFSGVKRRLDHLGECNGIDVYEDFAHHPTAVKSVIEAFKLANPSKRLFVAFEPRNASSRRNVFQDDFALQLNLADHVLIGQCFVDKRIPEGQRMDTLALAQSIGPKATSFESNIDLLSHLVGQLQPGDSVIFMSCGAFSGIQHRLLKELQEKRFA